MPEGLAAAFGIWGKPALFAAMVGEGPIATVIGAFLAAQGLIPLSTVYAMAVLADLTGDTLLYLAGRHGRLPRAFWHGRKGTGRRMRIIALKARFHRNGVRLLILGKLTHAAGFLVLLAAGAARMPIGRFLAANLLATLPKAALFLAIGYFEGETWQRIDKALWLFSSAMLVLLGLVAMRRLRRLKTCPQDI
jgi:membrane protein DedA with SNARE-associated domain